MPVIVRLVKGMTMTVNSGNARIFGSDSDAVYLAPFGTPLPSTINGALDAAFEDVGWLHSDGITETLSGSKTEIRGHQGQKVVRTRMDSPGTSFKFHALESKAQTQSLRYDESAATTSGGVRKTTVSAGQTVKVRAAVIDIFDADDSTVKERRTIERFEITPDGDRVFAGSDIAGFPFAGEVIGSYDKYEADAATSVAAAWDLTISGTPTGGTYTLTVNNATTAAIAFNATYTAVVAALNALSGVTGISGITGSGSAPIALTFPSSVTLSANGSNLTGGTTPDASVVVH